MSTNQEILDQLYFIRLALQPHLYLHPYASPTIKSLSYQVEEGITGAGVWSKEAGELMLQKTAVPLELISCTVVIENEKS